MDIKKRNKKLTEIEDILNSIKESLLILQDGLEMIATKEKHPVNRLAYKVYSLGMQAS